MNTTPSQIEHYNMAPPHSTTFEYLQASCFTENSPPSMKISTLPKLSRKVFTGNGSDHLFQFTQTANGGDYDVTEKLSSAHSRHEQTSMESVMVPSEFETSTGMYRLIIERKY